MANYNQRKPNQSSNESGGCLRGCGGCLIFIIVIIALISACSVIFNGNDHKDNSNDNKTEQTASKKTDDNNGDSADNKAKAADSDNKSTNKNHDSKNEQDKKARTLDRIPVTLNSTVDGDTAKFVYKGKVETFRFLLIDTPETKHPRIGKQPFGEEASQRTAELLKNAKNIEVEFDIGPKNDKYNRKLAYIYVDGQMLNQTLVEEGLAKVAYVYPPNTRYLSQLEAAQKRAKSQNLGIWSLESAFYDDNKDNDSASDNSNASNHSKYDDSNTSGNDTKSDESSSTTTKDESSTSNDDNNISSSDNTNSVEDQKSATSQSNNEATSDTTANESNSNQSFANCTELRAVHPDGVPQSDPAYAPKLDRDKDGYACEVN